MSQKNIEQESLIVSSIVNTIITGAGIWVFSVTHIQALFVDAFFSFIGLVSSILAVAISKASQKKTSSYPDGLYFLEPLYAVLKSLLTLMLLGSSVFSTSKPAYDYFAYGVGSPMNVGPTIPYAVSMFILCLGLGLYNRYQNKKINNASIILMAESKSNIIDGLQSLGIGIAVALLYAVDINGALGFLHYTGDFFVTLILALASVKEPIKVMIASFKELSGGVTKDKETERTIDHVITTHIGNDTAKIKYDIYKKGMHFKLRLSLLCNVDEVLIEKLKNTRKSILDELRNHYESIELIFIF